MDETHGAETCIGTGRVLLVGLEPWGLVAAAELASAGLGALHVVDDGRVGDDDLHGSRLLREADRGILRAEALARAVSRAGASGCVVTSSPLVVEPGRGLELAGARFDLILAAVPADDLVVLEAVARLGHARGVPSLTAHLAGAEAVLGPGVIPGVTACWSCSRLRQLANAERYAGERARQDALLRERARPRRRACLAPAAGLVGADLALAALAMLADPRRAPVTGRLVLRDMVSLRTSLHPVLRLPSCEVCGGAPRAELDSPRERDVRLDDARSPAELRRMLGGVVDERTGIVHRLVLEALGPAAYPEAPRTAMATLARQPHGGACSCRPGTGAGKGTTAVSAMLRAVGEAVERYAASCVDGVALRRASADALRAEGDVLAARDLAPYDASQYASEAFPLARVDDRTPIDWVRGSWLDSGAPVHVPALAAFFEYPAPPEERFVQVSSNGLAAGRSREDAALRAAVELCERDAFMLTWLSRRPARRVVLDDSVDAATREVVRQLEERGARLALYLLDAGVGVPTVMAVGFGDGRRWPGATVALAAHTSPHAALDKAVLEQGHVGPYLHRLMVEERHPIPERPEDVRSLDDHALYYFPPRRAEAFAFLDDGRSVRAAELAEPSGDAREILLARLRASGLRVAIVDVTSADLAPTPFRVARALGAGLVPIHFGHALAPLGSARLSAALAGRAPNPDPHPMA